MAPSLAPERPTAARTTVDLAACHLAFGPNDQRLCWWCGSDVPPGRYEWCSDRCEHACDVAHRWPLARSAALSRAASRCSVAGCQERRSVEVHHRTPVGRAGYRPGCQHHGENLAVLCEAHHDEQHRQMRPGRQMPLFLAA